MASPLSGALLALAFLPLLAAAQAANVGFIPANIWYSKEPFFAGETVRVHSVLYNSSDRDVVGTIVFLDGEREIGRADFSLARGRVEDVWIDWKATEGEHAITARIESARAKLPGGGEAPVALANATAAVRSVTVGRDSDRDGVGDEEEARRGTDPAKRDTDEDGIPDGEDPEPAPTKNAPAPAEELLAAIEGKIPVTVAESARKTIGALEAFRAEEAARAEERIEALRGEIRKTAVLPEGSEEAKESRSKRWTNMALLAANYVLLVLFKFQIAFYLALVAALFYGARFLWRLFGGHRFS